MRLLFLFFLIPFAAAVHTAGQQAQPPDVEILLNKNELMPGDTLNVQIVIKGYDLPILQPPRWPEIPGFTMVDSNTSELPTQIGKRFYVRYRHTCSYVPNESGITSLPPIPIQLPDRWYQTKPMSLRVLNPDGSANDKVLRAKVTKPVQPEPSAAPPVAPSPVGNNEIKVITQVSTTSPYKGAPVVIRYILLSGMTISSDISQVKRPDYKGFWLERVAFGSSLDPSASGGENYVRVPLDRIVLFPLQSGTLTIQPSTWKFRVRSPRQGFREEERTVSSEPIVINARSLPPLNHTSAPQAPVGDYQLDMRFGSTQLQLGQPFPIYLTIQGFGNIAALTPPEFPRQTAFSLVSVRMINSEGALKVESVRNELQEGYAGKKIWEYLVYPNTTGDPVFPAISHSFFSPTDSTYHTSATTPVRFHVRPAGDRSVRTLGENTSHNVGPSSVNTVWYVVITVMVLSFSGIGWVAWRRLKPTSRGVEGAVDLKTLLQEAENMAPHRGADGFYGVLQSMLQLHFNQAFGISIQAMNRDELRDTLWRNHYVDEDIDEVMRLLDMCDEARYSRLTLSAGQRQGMLATAKKAMNVPQPTVETVVESS